MDSATMETSTNPKNTASVTDKDVLCGRGGYCHQHPGNRLFRAIIKENKGTFEALIHEPIRKQMLVESIIQAIQHHGGRFLRKSQGQWIPISGKEAYTKVCHALRDIDYHCISSSSSGSDSSSATSDEGKSTLPQHSQFQRALVDKKVKKTLVQKVSVKETNDNNSANNNKTKTKNNKTNNNDLMNDQQQSKQRDVATKGGDDIPELVECNNDKKNKYDTCRQNDIVHNKENRMPAESMDDIPPVISVTEGSTKISKTMSNLSDDDADDDDDEMDSLRPLDPDEFVFESAEEFSHLCHVLLQYWGQGQ